MNIDGFIICVDEQGNEIRRDPCELRGAMYHNPGWSPNPVFVRFNKEVLDRYYTRDSRYVVGDLSLVWHDEGNIKRLLPIDDDHDNEVWVLFSRFALLPDEELPHWQIHNVPPEGKVSETYINRYAPGRTSTESNRPEHRFRNRYFALSQLCDAKLGWNLLLPLNSDDRYRLRCLRVPSSDEQSEFDELVHNLAIILVDSLNQGCIKKLVSDEEQEKLNCRKEPPKSIDYLEAALRSCNVTDTEKYVSFLRRLQKLRSIGSAHRKGRKYEKQLKKDFGIENQEYRQGFARILERAVETLEFFNRVVERGELTRKSELPPLYDLNEQLQALLQTLFPSGAESVFTSESWINERVPESRDIANQLMIKVVAKFDVSPMEFMTLCEDAVTSINSDINPSDIRNALIDIAKVFITDAGSNLPHGINLLYDAQRANVQLTEFFEHLAGKAAYCKKLVAYSRVLIELDEVKDCAWYSYYVASYLSYARTYTLYAYEHVLHVDDSDSGPIILDAVDAVQSAADVAEKVVNVETVRKAARDLEHLVK